MIAKQYTKNGSKNGTSMIATIISKTILKTVPNMDPKYPHKRNDHAIYLKIKEYNVCYHFGIIFATISGI